MCEAPVVRSLQEQRHQDQDQSDTNQEHNSSTIRKHFRRREHMRPPFVNRIGGVRNDDRLLELPCGSFPLRGPLHRRACLSGRQGCFQPLLYCRDLARRTLFRNDRGQDSMVGIDFVQQAFIKPARPASALIHLKTFAGQALLHVETHYLLPSSTKGYLMLFRRSSLTHPLHISKTACSIHWLHRDHSIAISPLA